MLVVIGSACRDSASPAGPTAPTPIAPVPTQHPGSDFPAVIRPARVYLFANALSYQVSDLTRTSRYVLYDDGSFALQYLRSLGSLEYPGTYIETNSVITLNWEGWSVMGPWGATGSLSGDALSVRYNLVMQLTDFEDGVYVQSH